MENNPKIVKRIEEIIEELACYNNPGPAAVKAAHIINDDYLLIPETDLPVVEVTGSRAHTDTLTEYVCDGNTEAMRKKAYQYLAMAEYVDRHRKTKEAEELAANRLEVWRELNPLPFGSIYFKENWKWENLKTSEKKAIDLILDLRKSQIDS